VQHTPKEGIVVTKLAKTGHAGLVVGKRAETWMQGWLSQKVQY